MIQDIAPSVFENHFVDYKAHLEDTAFYFSEGKLLCFYDENNKNLKFPKIADFAASKAVYLFSIDNKKYFLIQQTDKMPETLSVFSFQLPYQLPEAVLFLLYLQL